MQVGQSVPGYVTTFPPLLEMPSPRTRRVLFGAVAVCLAIYSVPALWEPLQLLGLDERLVVTYVSIPIVSVVFTYVHIWQALFLTFYPIRYIGCLQIPETNAGCGWQGIIPNKAEKMARTSVRLMTEKLIRVRDITSRIDPQMVVQELQPIVQSTLFDTIQEVAMQEEPKIWESLPATVKSQLLNRANRDAPAVIASVMHDLQNNIETVFDLEDMVVQTFTEEPNLLNHMFISCGYDELKFIRDCGAYMGGAFGLVQVVLWMFYTAGWMLPTFGFFAGILSNWLALKMIFEPVNPVNVCGYELQGLFLKRQAQVSEVYAQIVADNVLYARNIIRAILTGRLSDELFDLFFKHISASTDKTLGVSTPLVKLFRSESAITRLKFKVADDILHRLPNTARHVEQYLDAAMDLEDLLRQKLQELPPEDFENLLHPVFQEDEWKLVLMGGVLGIVIGCAQWHFLGS